MRKPAFCIFCGLCILTSFSFLTDNVRRGYQISIAYCLFSFFSFMDSFVFKQQVLFRVDFLSVTLDHRVQCPRVGQGVKI